MTKVLQSSSKRAVLMGALDLAREGVLSQLQKLEDYLQSNLEDSTEMEEVKKEVARPKLNFDEDS